VFSATKILEVINMPYNRTNAELESKACRWWPDYLVTLEADTSIIPTLLNTQDEFISILTLSDSMNTDSVFNIMTASNFGANLFLKHLMILTDFGSEPLQRINRNFLDYFPSQSMQYAINGVIHEYHFTSLPSQGVLNHKKMRTDSSNIVNTEPLTPFYKDLIILLLFGSCAIDESIANIFYKCTVGSLIGKSAELKVFIKQRYIFVSRITGGAQANELGNAAQNYVKIYLENKLGDEYTVLSNGRIPGITHNDGRTLTTFDLTIEKNAKFVGIEISFQVTTNSTIERKAGQAQSRLVSVEATENYIAYIIDGAGNFQRQSALTTICANSHCTVAYTEEEFDVLIDFIKEKLG
jgi:hypothetical protein